MLQASIPSDGNVECKGTTILVKCSSARKKLCGKVGRCGFRLKGYNNNTDDEKKDIDIRRESDWKNGGKGF